MSTEAGGNSPQGRPELVVVTPEPQLCGVPGCKGKREEGDCCIPHSEPLNGATRRIPNDGIIDWTAIDLAVSGARTVKLTWVEAYIAAATILAAGDSARQVRARVGLEMRTEASREAIHHIEEAIRNSR